MIGNIPIPQGPILEFVKSEYQGDGHSAKKQLVEETADLSNKIVASYIFYIDKPSTVTERQIQEFKRDIEEYGKRAVEVMNFANQSNAPEISEERLQTMRDIQELMSTGEEDKQNTAEEVLNRSLKKLGADETDIQIEPRETLDSFFNKIDNELYTQYYAILDYIIDQCVSFAVDDDISVDVFENLKLYNEVAISRM